MIYLGIVALFTVNPLASQASFTHSAALFHIAGLSLALELARVMLDVGSSGGRAESDWLRVRKRPKRRFFERAALCDDRPIA